MMLRINIMKSTKPIRRGYFLAAGLQPDRPWLQIDDEKGMTRKICVEHYYGPIWG